MEVGAQSNGVAACDVTSSLKSTVASSVHLAM